MTQINNKFLVVTVVALLLYSSTWPVRQSSSPSCSVSCLNDDDFIKIGCNPKTHIEMLDDVDFILGGVFPTNHLLGENYQPNYAGIMWVSAMLYALDEINNNATILPGIKLGYAIYDSCDSVQLSARHALNFMVNKDFYDFTNVPAPVNSSNKNIVINNNNNNDARPKLIGVVGGAGSSISSLLNNIISSEFMPQISYSSTSETLAQRWRYRSFLRTVPSDKHLAVAIVDMIRFFGWTYVSAFAIDDEYGRVGLQELQAAAKRSGICLEHAQTFDVHLEASETAAIVDHLIELTDNTTHIVILWAPFPTAHLIMKRAEAQGISANNLLFIGPHIWTEYFKLSKVDFKFRTIIFELGQPSLKDTFLDKMSRDLTLNWINPWFRNIFQNGCPQSVFFSPAKPPKCGWPVPPQAASAVISERNRKYPQVIAAVYAFAFGLHEYLGCTKTTCTNDDDDKNKLFVLNYERLFDTIKRQNFTVPRSHGFRVSFDPDTGEMEKKEYLFKLFYHNWTIVQVGRWYGPGNITARDSTAVWGRGGKPSGRCSNDCRPGSYRLIGSSACCWTCPSCPSNTISTGFNEKQCTGCDPDFEVANLNQTSCYRLREIRITLTRDGYVGLLLLTSSISGVLLVLFIILVFVRYWNTPVVKSSSREISIIQLLSLMLLFCLPALYFFPLTPLFCTFRTLVFGFLFTTVVSIILVKTYRLIRVFSERFTKVSRFLHNKYQIIFIYALVVFELIAVLLWNWNFQPSIVSDVRKLQLVFYLKCDYNQTIIFWIVMLYIFILTIISGYYAFRARKLPENYNDAQYISLSMFTAIVVWIAYVPLFFSLEPYSNNIAFLFQNFICTLALTLILYGYKVFVILFKPRLNSPEHARQQHRDRFLDSLHRDQWRRQNTVPEKEPFRPRLASLPVAVHPPSVFDEPDGKQAAGRGRLDTLNTGERQRLINRLQPRRASFSSMSQLERCHQNKSYESVSRTGPLLLDVQKREMRKSQSTSFLLDSASTEMKEPPRSATSHSFLHGLSGFRKVLSTISINRLLLHDDHHHHHHHKNKNISEKTSLLHQSSDDGAPDSSKSSGSELNTRL